MSYDLLLILGAVVSVAVIFTVLLAIGDFPPEEPPADGYFRASWQNFRRHFPRS